MGTGIILLIILGAIAVIALIAYFIYRYTHLKLKEDKPSEEEVLKDEMDRLLQPIEDDETRKQVEDYQEKDD